MGKHNAYRDFLLALFPQCFSEELPDDTHFDMCIIDLMQYVAKMRAGIVFKPREAIDSLLRSVFDHANIGNHSDRPIIDKALVLLLDTAKNVPKCKATTQIARDTGGARNEEDEEEDGGEGDACDDDDDDDNDDGGGGETIMTEELYNELLVEMGLLPGDYMIHANMRRVPEKMKPKMVWRSNNLKWQLNSMIVSALLKNLTVEKGKVAVIDDGVLIAGGNEGYQRLRKEMIRDYHFEDRSDYEKDLLISFLVTHTMTNRYVLHHDGQFKRLPESGIGEADVKIGNYIAREVDGKPNPIRRYLVVSQDTDIFVILLAHMKRLIDPETGKVDEDIEVWIDSQRPADRSKGLSKAYRYINVKSLYYAIMGLFRDEYPTVANPIETLLFLINMLDTDFTMRLGARYLGVTRRTVWNLFSETHYQPKKSDDPSLVSPGYLVFGKKVARAKIFKCAPKAYQLLSGEAISIVYTEETNEYCLVMDYDQCAKFLYLVAQQNFVRDMTALKALAKTPTKFYYADPDVMLIAARDLVQSITQQKNADEEVERQSVTKLLGKSFILPSSPTQPSKKARSSISPGISLTPSNSAHRYDRVVMAKLAKKKIPDAYSIPTRGQMKARLARLDWVINYLQNGTVLRGMSALCDSSSQIDEKQSLYGWKRIEMEPIGANLNSSYHTQVLKTCLLGEMPLSVHATVECDVL